MVEIQNINRNAESPTEPAIALLMKSDSAASIILADLSLTRPRQNLRPRLHQS